MDNEDIKTGSKAFLALLVPNQMRIQAFILALVPNVTDAEDIYQETVYVMWDKFSTFEVGTDFVAWAVTIAKFKILEFRAKQQKSKVQFSDKIYESLESVAASQMPVIQDHLDALKDCIHKLSEKEKSLLGMRYAANMSFRQMSSRVGKNTSALHRTLAIIHSKLALCVRRVLHHGEIA